MAVDFTYPKVTDLRATVLQEIRDYMDGQSKLFDGTTLTNTPTGAIRYGSGSSRFEKWNGSSWIALPLLEINNTLTLKAAATLGLSIQNSSGTPFAIELYRTDTSNSSKVYNSGSSWAFEHRPTFNGNLAWDAGNFNPASYLTTASASATYQTLSGMSSYLTTAAAAAAYQTLAGMGSYLTTASASATYQTISGMSSYVTSSYLTANYLTSAGVAAGYLALSGGNLTGQLNTDTTGPNTDNVFIVNAPTGKYASVELRSQGTAYWKMKALTNFSVLDIGGVTRFDVSGAGRASLFGATAGLVIDSGTEDSSDQITLINRSASGTAQGFMANYLANVLFGNHRADGALVLYAGATGYFSISAAGAVNSAGNITAPSFIGNLTGTASGAAWGGLTGVPSAVSSLSGVNTGDQTNISGNSATTSQRTFSRVRTDGLNRGGFGSISISGASGGWMGIDFTDAAATFMVSGTSHGTYRNDSTWDWLVTSGTLNVGTVPWANLGSIPAAVSLLSGTNTGDQTNISGNAATATTATNLSGGSVSATTLTATGPLKGNSGSKGWGAITTTTTAGTPTGGSSGDFVLVY